MPCKPCKPISPVPIQAPDTESDTNDSITDHLLSGKIKCTTITYPNPKQTTNMSFSHFFPLLCRLNSQIWVTGDIWASWSAQIALQVYFFHWNCGVPKFFSQPTTGLTNQDPIWDSQASAPLHQAEQFSEKILLKYCLGAEISDLSTLFVHNCITNTCARTKMTSLFANFAQGLATLLFSSVIQVSSIIT